MVWMRTVWASRAVSCRSPQSVAILCPHAQGSSDHEMSYCLADKHEPLHDDDRGMVFGPCDASNVAGLGAGMPTQCPHETMTQRTLSATVDKCYDVNSDWRSVYPVGWPGPVYHLNNLMCRNDAQMNRCSNPPSSMPYSDSFSELGLTSGQTLNLTFTMRQIISVDLSCGRPLTNSQDDTFIPRTCLLTPRGLTLIITDILSLKDHLSQEGSLSDLSCLNSLKGSICLLLITSF